MLFTIGGTATTSASYKKQFGRWKAWYSNESSFASGDEKMLRRVLEWCRSEQVITIDECKAIDGAMSAMLHYIGATSTSSDFSKSLGAIQRCLSQLAQIKRVAGTKGTFLDIEEGQTFGAAQLKKLAPRGVRLDKRAKRWKVVEAAVIGITTAEKITRLFESARSTSKNWGVPQRDVARFKAITKRIAEQVSTALRQSPLTESEIKRKADEVFSSLLEQMNTHFQTLQHPDKVGR